MIPFTMKLGREFATELADIAREHGPELARRAAQKGLDQAKATVTNLPIAKQVQSFLGQSKWRRAG